MRLATNSYAIDAMDQIPNWLEKLLEGIGAVLTGAGGYKFLQARRAAKTGNQVNLDEILEEFRDQMQHLRSDLRQQFAKQDRRMDAAESLIGEIQEGAEKMGRDVRLLKAMRERLED